MVTWSCTSVARVSLRTYDRSRLGTTLFCTISRCFYLHSWRCGSSLFSARTPCPAPSIPCAPAEWASRTPLERSLALACLFQNYQVSHLHKVICVPLRDQLWIGPDNIWSKDFIGAELVPISKVSRQLMLYTCFLTKVKLDLKFSDSPKLDLVRDHYGHCL